MGFYGRNNMSDDEILELCHENIRNIYEIDENLLRDTTFVALLLAQNPDEEEFIADFINYRVGIDIFDSTYRLQIMDALIENGYYDIDEPSNSRDTKTEKPIFEAQNKVGEDIEPIDKSKNKFDQYANWIEVIKQKCNEENFVKIEDLDDKNMGFKHYALDNNLHVYIKNPEVGGNIVWIFDGPSRLRDQDMQRSFCIADYSVFGYSQMNLGFKVGDVMSIDNTPGFIDYDDYSEKATTFLPDKAGRDVSSDIDDSYALYEDIGKKLENAIKNTTNPVLQDSYKKALEFYSKIQEIAKTQNKETGKKKTVESKTALEELEELRDKKQQLQEQQDKIAEAEKLVEAMENQGPNLDK